MSRTELFCKNNICCATAAIALVFAANASVYGAILVQWNFTDNDSTVDVSAANLTTTPYNAGSGLNDVTYTADAGARGYNPTASASASLSGNLFWTFTVTAASGFHLDLTNLTFDEQREDKGPVSFQVFDGSNSALSGVLTSATSITSRSVDLSAPAYDNLSSVTFKIAAWNASNNGNTSYWFNDNVTLNGAVLENTAQGPLDGAVPEPASMAVWGSLSLIGLAWARRRKQLAA